jgi:hypothetical protein
MLGLYPRTVLLNRGNHEARDMNKVYGFEGEVKHKHGEQTYKVSRFSCLLLQQVTYSSFKLFADAFTSCRSSALCVAIMLKLVVFQCLSQR